MRKVDNYIVSQQGHLKPLWWFEAGAGATQALQNHAPPFGDATPTQRSGTLEDVLFPARSSALQQNSAAKQLD